jgi:hypothetical protein
VASSVALATHLASLGLVKYPPDSDGPLPPAYIESVPDKAGRCLLIVTRPSPPPDKVSAWAYPILGLVGFDEPGPSLPVRDLVRSCVDAVHGTFNTVWAPTSPEHRLHVTECVATSSEPLPLAADARGRQRWTQNVQLETNTDPS